VAGGDLLFCLISIVCVGWSVRTFAQSPDGKIGVVDLQRVIDSSEKGKQAQAEVQKKGDELSQKVKAMEDELQAMKADIEKQSVALTSEAKQEKLDAIEKKDVEYQRFVKDAQAEFRKAEQRALKDLYDEIRQIVVKYGKDNNYAVIMEIQMVIYRADAVDLTNEIIKVYNSAPNQAGK
jgi:outer membrane protein